MSNYVAYYRVSTAKQGKSGLGLAAQREKIEAFAIDKGTVIADFTEIESGRRDQRCVLWEAIEYAKIHEAKLVIARLDRFSRNVSFISKIMDEGIELTIAEMPDATTFQLHIFAALAQEERRLISERTKAALAQAKKRGAILGRNGAVLAQQNKDKAAERNEKKNNNIEFISGFSNYRIKIISEKFRL
jgi:DNA invertase Pin-like site-specific DNA recombinase